jgi:hypothetical protein
MDFNLSQRAPNEGSGMRRKLNFQTEVYAITAFIVENLDGVYKKRSIYILSYNQAMIKALDNYQINSNPAWGCHLSLVKLAEHTGFNL